MILLSSIVETFQAEYLRQFGPAMSADQHRALAAMGRCRTSASARMQARCLECDHSLRVPHSCGHRLCPHCQHHESQQWLERQLKRQVPATYFLLTFTLPAQLRALARRHPRAVYDAMTRCSWDTVNTFCQNDAQLQGSAGAIAVLHTHSRRLDFHPHVHLVMPAAALDAKRRLWRTKRAKAKTQGRFLFPHKALAKVFRAKLLAALKRAGLALPAHCPAAWVVDVKAVGSGDQALVYLGRYLYRGVIQEKDIVACDNGLVTFRFRHAKRKRFEYRTLPGAQFLALILLHVLPKGFRRARNFGFLHPNSKRLIALLHFLFGLNPKQALAHLKPRPGLRCPCCGGPMQIVKTRIPVPDADAERPPAPTQLPLALPIR